MRRTLYEAIVSVFKYRWTASILMVVVLDIATYLAFSKPTGPVIVAHQDKLMHALAFFGFYVLGHLSLNFDFFPAVSRFSPAIAATSWILWIGYGIFIEMVQKFLSYRSASVADLFADIAGIFLGTLFVTLIKLYPRSKAPHEPS